MAIKDTVVNILIKAKDLSKGALDKFRTNIKKTGEESTKAESKLGNFAKRIAAVVAASVGFYAVKNAFVSVLATGDKFEKLGVQLTALMGSIEGGEQAAAWIKDFAKKTPLQLDGVTQAFTRLKAYGLDPMDGTMQAIVDQSEKLGGGQETLIGISTALGQAWAKQKLQAEEMNQLVERGVPVYQLLADATGKTTKEIIKMRDAGLLGRDTIKALMDEMGKQSSGAAVANMSLLSGIISNLKDTWTEFLDEVSKAGALDYAKNQVQALADKLQEMKKSGELKEWAKRISDGMTATAEAVKSFATGIYNARGAIKAFIVAWAGMKIIAMISNVKALAVAFLVNLAPAIGKTTIATIALSKALIGLSIASAKGLGGIAANSISAVKGLGKAKAAALGLGKNLRTAGLVGAVVTVGASVVDLGVKTWGLIKAKSQLAVSQKQNIKAMADEAKAIKDFNLETGLAVKTLDEMIDLEKQGAVERNKSTGQWVAVSKAVEEAANKMDGALSKSAQSIYDTFSDLESGSKETATAIKEALSNIELGSIDGLRDMSTAMAKLVKDGKITSDELSNGLAATLEGMTANEIAAFRVALGAVFDGGKENAEQYVQFLESAVSASLRKLGVDLNELETGISSAGQEAISLFDGIVESAGKATTDVSKSAKQISAAFEAALGKIKTTTGIDTLKEKLVNTFKAGKISTQQYEKALSSIEDKYQSLSGKAEETTEKVSDLKEVMDSTGSAGSKMGDDVQEAAQKTAGAGATISATIEGWASSLGQMSMAARSAFEALVLGARGAGDNVDPLTNQIESLNNEISRVDSRMLTSAGFSGFSRFLAEVGQTARKTQVAYLEQKQSFDKLMESYKSGEMTLQRFVSQARSASGSLNLLSGTDMSALTGALDQAEQKMERLRDSSQSTQENLQNELDRLQGNTQAVETRRYEARVRDLQDKLDEARDSGDAKSATAALESLAIAENIYRVKLQQASLDKKAKSEAAKKEAQAAAPAATTQTIKLEGGGNTVLVQTDNPTKLIDVLSSAGMRTN